MPRSSPELQCRGRTRDLRLFAADLGPISTNLACEMGFACVAMSVTMRSSRELKLERGIGILNLGLFLSEKL